MRPKDLEWRDIGSGMVAKTFLGATRMWTTSKSSNGRRGVQGPLMDQIQSRKIWSLTTGRLIDECDVDRTPDSVLGRDLPAPDDIRVELVLKGAQELYRRRNPGVAELYSQPRVCQEASTQKFGDVVLRPGWSLDLTTKDPETGRPWDLSDPAIQRKVKRLVRETEPFCVVGSPPCTAFSPLQELSRKKRKREVVAREFREARAHI